MDSSSTTSLVASLYVTALHPEVTEAMLHEKFSQAGPVLSVRIRRNDITGQSLGSAYVSFQQPAHAELALKSMNYTPIKGHPIQIMLNQQDPSLRKSGADNLFIKNLDKSIDDKMLYDTFSTFGKILSSKVSCDEQGSKGYGFVQFETQQAALSAIEEVNGMWLKGKKVYVGKFLTQSERSKKMEERVEQFTNVYIKNFGDKLDEKSLKEMFEKFGTIKSVAVMKDASGNSLGFGFVAFKKHEEAQKAVEEMNGYELEGESLYVGRAQNKQERLNELQSQSKQQKQDRIQRLQGVNLYVKNLEDHIKDDDLRESFSQYGTITSVKIMSDGEKSKGFGFVCFSSPEEAKRAMTEMNGRIVGSTPLYVALAQCREDRKAHLTAQKLQKMSSRMGMRMNNVIGKSFQAAGAPGFYVPFQGPQRIYMPAGHHVIRATPRWQSPQANFQLAGDMRVGPWGPSGPAILPMITPVGAHGTIHPSQHMVQQQVMQQPFKYIQSVRNPNMAGYTQPGQAQTQQQQQQQQQESTIQQAVHVQGQEPLTASMLAAAQPQEQKQMLGERLYPLIESSHPDLASKITSMLLEIDNSELLHMLESRESLKAKVEEAVAVLQAHQHKVQQTRQSRPAQAAPVVAQDTTALMSHQHEVPRDADSVASDAEHLYNDSMTHSMPGIVQHISTTEWLDYAKLIENQHQCKIGDLKVVETNSPNRDEPLFSQSMSLLEACECKYGEITVKVIQGDITTDDVDAIVNGCGKGFNVNWGVLSSSILRKAGQQMQKECSKAHSVDHPMIRVTSGGRLPCKHVLHMVTPNTVDELGKKIKMALEVANSLKLASLAFPTLGTGGIGLSVDDVASIMRKAFQQFIADSPKHLKLIKVVVYESSILSTCRQCIVTPQMFTTYGNQQLQKVKVKVASLPPTVSFQISSKNKEEYDKVKEKLKGHLSKVSLNKRIDENIFKEFTDSEWLDVYREAATQSVSLTMTSRTCITLQGLQQSVSNVCDVIKDVTSEFREAKTMRKLCIWQLSTVGDNFDPVPLRMSRAIEHKYEEDKTGFFSHNLFNEIASIDLSTMTFYFKGIRANLRRIDNKIAPTQSTSLPTHWDVMRGKTLRKVTLSPNSQEFGRVSRLFNSSKPAYSSIIKIKRIQNPSLYEQYLVKKKEIQHHVTTANQVERELFHGTSHPDAEKITVQGFDRGFAGKNATLFGHGVYFATKSSYSANYSTADTSGTSVMFLAQVLTGDFCVGNSTLKVAPVKPSTKDKHILYDSVVDRLASPNLFVVFKDPSAYPAYLISYK